MRKLIIFTVTDLDKMLEKGNVWYLRHYEAYFDKVYVVYILGAGQKTITNGRTMLISLGMGNQMKDLFFAPYRLYKFAKKTGSSYYLTADSLFLWWTSFLIKALLKAEIYFMPVCMPEQVYKNSKRSLSGVPIWMERIFLRLCFMATGHVITTKNAPGFVDWLKSVRCIRSKLRVVDVLVEEMPTMEFYESLSKEMPHTDAKARIILYVGRLHHEKMVGDLVKMFACVQTYGLNVRFRIIGDGAEKKNMESMATALGVRDKIDFLGLKPNSELVRYYKEADVFVSPLTGSSLREAALCKLPVVAYNIDWVKGLLVHEENALLVEKGDVEGMARQVKRVLLEKELARSVAEALYGCALKKWDISRIAIGLEQAFGN